VTVKLIYAARFTLLLHSGVFDFVFLSWGGNTMVDFGFVFITFCK